MNEGAQRDCCPNAANQMATVQTRPFPSRQVSVECKGFWFFSFGMRAIWKGSITFGLVYIPVAVYPATREEKISFKKLRARDLSPIRYKKIAEADEKEVKPEEIVKG